MMWVNIEGKVREVVPFVAMVTMEGCTIALTIWAKTVLTNGMSPFVFVVYVHALSSIILLPFSVFLHRNDRFFIFSSTPEHWILGGLLFAAANLSVSVWNVLQMGTVKQYPQPMNVASFYGTIGTIQSAILSFLVLERNLDAWEVGVNTTEIPLIVLTATFVGLITTCVHVWCQRMKGPFYVPMFKPFGLLFATTFDVSLPASTLRCGSVIGTAIVAMGYLSVMYGQQNEEVSRKYGTVDLKLGETPEEKVPLLQEENV